MIPSSFDYLVPTSVDEAVALLQAHAGDAKILAGGQSLIPMLKLRLAEPAVLIDINRISALGYVEERDGALHIGALAREGDLERSALVRQRYEILNDTTAVIADPLVRNSATVCGNIAHGDPGNDHPATMLALDALFVARGPSGERRIAARDFFLGLFSTALNEEELLTEIEIPRPAERSGGAYLKLERKVGDYATAGVAVQVILDASGGCARAGIGLTNVGAMAIEAVRAQDFLRNKPLDAATIAQAAEIAASEADPLEDRRGSADYKRDVVRVLTGRALRLAASRATGANISTPVPFTYSPAQTAIRS
ncbi:MAG TPA: xanthine dehydrogenase family protein subunit M [Gemmatimonadaceae bacterium]|nr:xanthine dehydrogenase family protein subunit M [Gemmatimonadaceae bacterium]